MNKFIFRTVSVFSVFFLILLMMNEVEFKPEKLLEKQKKENENYEYEKNEEKNRDAALNGENSYDPMVNVSADEKIKLWEQVNRIPSESNNTDAISSWKSLGPFGIRTTDNKYFAGRVTDIKPPSGNTGLRISTAMGGLWEYSILFGYSISDGLPSQSIGSFDSHPDSSDIIFAGTGEHFGGSGFGLSVGAGLYKTTNKGLNWSLVPLSPTPNSFSKIRYNPANKNYIFIASDLGLYRSTNAGGSFTRLLSGDFTDIGFVQSSPGWIFASKLRKGFYFSDAYGANWDSVNFSGLPQSNIGDIKFDIAKSSPNIMYASISSDTLCIPGTGLALGMKVFRSTDYGISWSRINNHIGQNDYVDYSWCQGYYNNVCSINPVNPNIVYVGGGPLHCTTDGGTSWREFYFHPDQHATAWNAAGTLFYSGSDGGIATTQDNGTTWNSVASYLPLTQFYDGDVGTANTNVIVGGSQDNANPYTTDGGNSWIFGGAGDGWSSVINPANSNNFIISWNGALQRTTNGGLNFTDASSGISSIMQLAFFASDKYSPLNMYYYSNGFAYKTITGGSSWSTLNPGNPFQSSRSTLSVEKGRATGGREVVYMPQLFNALVNRLYVYVNGTTYERSGNLPYTGRGIWRVCTHPRDTGVAYALMPGTGSIPQIYKTKNTGLNWYNVSGNFPGVPIKDLICSPVDSNILVACSQGFGFFKSTNAGQNWFKWNNGTPLATFSDKMTYIDSTSNGRFYVVAITNGRGVYTRNISDSDSILTGVNNNMQKINYRLQQNFPNPFNPVTNIKYSVPKSTNVKLTVYDLTGKSVVELVNEKKSAGIYDVIFDGKNISSGIYFYRLETDGFIETKKMILVK